MLAQILDISYFEAAFFRDIEHMRDGDQFAVWEDIGVGESGFPRSGPIAGPSDTVIQKDSARPQHLKCTLEILGQLGLAHMLDHADTHQLVIAPSFLKVAIIEEPNFASVRESFPLNTFSCEIKLMFT